jgi:hypothetical protein
MGYEWRAFVFQVILDFAYFTTYDVPGLFSFPSSKMIGPYGKKGCLGGGGGFQQAAVSEAKRPLRNRYGSEAVKNVSHGDSSWTGPIINNM